MVSVILLLCVSSSAYAQLPGLQMHEQNPFEGIEQPAAQGSAEAEEPMVIALADESEGPDSGNWHEKLKWWKEAKWTYVEHIVPAMEHLASLEQAYATRQQGILSQLQDYSAALPVERQIAAKEIDDLIRDMVRRQNEMAKEEPKGVDESQSEALESQKRMLSELKEKFGQFNTLAQRIQSAFDTIVPKQINDAKSYDKKALEAYKAIEHTLDDKKAEQLYHEVENSLENIKAITNYLTGPLNAFLDQAWSTSQGLMSQLTMGIHDLENRGVVVRSISPAEKEQMTAIEEQRKELKAIKAAEAEAARKRAARPWYEKVLDAIGSFFSTLWSYITLPFAWLGSLFNSSSKTSEKTNAASCEITPSADSATGNPT